METTTENGLAKTQTPAEKVNLILKGAKKAGTMLGLKSSEILTVFEANKMQIANALPKHLTPERMMQVATSCVAKNPAIQECTVPSIAGAVVSASILGLNFALGEGYLVPYNKKVKNQKGEDVWIKECQLQIGYQGFVKLARQSGEIKSISAHVVRKGDTFNFCYGLNETLEHVPNPDADGDITHAYAVAHYKDGGYNCVVLTRNQIEALRKRSPMQKETPSMAWATDYEAMACAKAIKQLAKWLPKSDTLQTATKIDEAKIDITNIREGEIDLQSAEYTDAEFQMIDEPKEDDSENKKAKK